MKDGVWRFYFPNGQMMSEGNFKNDKEEGHVTWYNYDGSINTKQTGKFKNGFKVSD